MAAVRYTVIDKDYFGWTSDDDFTITYNQNASGIVENIKQSGEEGVTATLIWEDTPMGIAFISSRRKAQKRFMTYLGKTS